MAKKRPSERPDEFQRLIREAVEGNWQVFGELSNPLREMLRQHGQRYFPKELKGKTDVSDLIQETLLRAWKSFHEFQGKTKGELAAWLKVIMDHIIKDLRRDFHAHKRDVIREVTLDALMETVNVIAPSSPGQEESEEVSNFRQVFPRLPELYRQVLYLRNYQRLTYKEIAARLGGTAEGIRKLYVRAVKKFTEEWEKLKE
jgi:RNA polymerase sigma-70 factor (subfamily 1)